LGLFFLQLAIIFIARIILERIDALFAQKRRRINSRHCGVHASSVSPLAR